MGRISLTDNVYASVGDTVSISNNRFLIYYNKIIVLSVIDRIINDS